MKIVDRVVTALMAFAVIPAAIFTPMLHWLYQITVVGIADSLLGAPLSGIEGDTGWTEDYVSLKWLYDRVKYMGIDLKNIGSSANSRVQEIMPFVKVAAIFFAIAVLTAFVIGVVAVFTNAKRTQIGLSLFGIASLVVCMVCFNRFAAPLIAGEITLGSLLDMPIISYITKLGELNLSTAWFFTFGLFVAIIVWSISYIVTLPEKEASKYRRKGRKA